LDKQLVMVQPLRVTATRFALVSIFSGAMFLLLLFSLHFLQPEFDPTWRFISEYALGNYGWIMHLAYGLLAISQISVAITLFPVIRSVMGYIGLVILGISAVGVIIAAIFVTDPISVSPEDATFSGSMHSIGAMLDYTPVTALLISLSLCRLDDWRPMKRVLLTSSIIAIVAMLVFVLQIPQDGQFGPEVLAGLFGRFLIVADIAWLITVGIHATKLGVSKQ